jgi:rRNA processing protein Gar1
MTCYGFVMDVLGPIADSGVPFILVNDSSENGPGRI